jgi:hypothetical protein
MSSQVTTTSPTIFSAKPNDGPTKSFVLSCIDPRFAYATEQYLYDKYTRNNLSFDHFVLAGSALGGNLTGPGSGVGQCNILSANSNWNKTLIEHIQVAISLHNVEGVEVIDHLNCGAYGACIAGISSGPTGDQGATFHRAQYFSLASSVTGASFVSHNNIIGTAFGNVVLDAGVTGRYFNGYTTSPTTTLIDYGGNSILTERKGTYSGAKVLVLGCIDPRYSSVLSAFLREYKGVQFIYDLFVLAGASIGANQSYLANGNIRLSGNRGNYPNNILADTAAGIGPMGVSWGPTFFDHLSLARSLHGITEVWVFDHLDCGAYKAVAYGDLSNPDLVVETHVAEMSKLKASIDGYTTRTGPITDPLNTSPYSLGFKGFVIDLDGNIGKYVDGNTIFGAESSLTVASSVSRPGVLIRDSSDYTKIVKQARLFREFSGRASTGGSQTAYNNVFSQPYDYSIIQSNEARITYNLGRNVCGCTGAFSTSPLGT